MSTTSGAPSQPPVALRDFTANRPDYLGGGRWSVGNANLITVIFGKNGSGKSVFLRSLRDVDRTSFHYSSPERGGNITYDEATAVQESQLGGNPRSRTQNFDSNFRQDSISRIQTVANKLLDFMARGQEPPAFPVKFDEMEAFLNALLPGFEFSVSPGRNPPFRLLRRQSEPVETVAHLSSGEAEIFSIGCDLITKCALWVIDKHSPRVLLLDEPDTHLHPDLQQHLASSLVGLVEKYKVQIVVATHSTTLLSALGTHGGETVSVLYFQDTTEPQKAVQFDRYLKDLSICLGGHALMGPLFSAPLLLIEGDDDYKIWSWVPRYKMVRLAALPCEGKDGVKDGQRALERLFASLLTTSTSPSGYALLDGDSTLPTTDSHPQEHVRFLRLNCREAENLYLTDEVLGVLGLDWETAQTKIKTQSVNFGQKAAQLNSCSTWDRRSVDLKEVISQIAQILDSKNVLWTLRVAQQVGSGPNGQLADFLGQGILDAFWPAGSVQSANPPADI